MANGQIFIGRVTAQRSDSFNIRCDRRSPIGNPYYMADESKRNEVCDKFDHWLPKAYNNDPQVYSYVNNIAAYVMRGSNVNLQCHCFPKRCHTKSIRSFVLGIIQAKEIQTS